MNGLVVLVEILTLVLAQIGEHTAVVHVMAVQHQIVGNADVAVFLHIGHNITMRWADFTVKEYDIFAMLSISNAESYPLSLEERYEFTYNVTGYEKEVIDDNGIRFSVKYSDAKNKKCISYSQSIKDFYTTVRLNIENAITLPKEVIINGTTAIYYETYYGEKGVIWDIGDYIIELAATGFSEDELISMTEFVEKVE